MTLHTQHAPQYPLRIGLVGVGLEAYWPQFDGLQQRLRGYLDHLRHRLDSNPGRCILDLGLVDNHPSAIQLAHDCRSQDIDLLLVYLTTYSLSTVILPAILRAGVPIVLLNLQPDAAIDYQAFNRLPNRTAMTAEWLAFCSACPMPEIANVLRRLDRPFHQITGTLRDDDPCWPALEQWLTAAQVRHTLAHSRMGLMGHYYSGMLDIATDLTQLSGRFGTWLEMIEVDHLSTLRRAVTPEQLAAKLADFRAFFTIDSDCPPAELERAAATSAALDHLVREQSLDLLAYYHKGSGVPENENTMSSIILGATMLTSAGVPIAGEYEIKNALAMKILHELGAGGSFTEFYAMDLDQDLVLMGHDGPGHAAIAQQPTRVRRLEVYHGKVGLGLSVEMAVRNGPVTLLSLVEDRIHGFLLLVAQGESVPGPILEIGNTNSRYRFPLGARGFVEAWSQHGPAHHCAIGTGHHAEQIRKLAALMNLGFCQVC